ncbi:MAG: UDP-N-acetylmuramoyl-L-alanyl-D-glutamate--2,6-diaminopimelate ligase [Gammaproteobacteria bacterium]
MSLSALLDGIGVVPPALDRDIHDLTLDSREAGPGSCFVALAGRRHDGFEFAVDAARRGAAAVLAEAPAATDVGVPVIAVPSLRQELGRLSRRFFDDPSAALEVCAVTGTNGKTTVAHLAAQALERLGGGCGYIGTLGAGRPGRLTALEHTTPDVITLNRWLERFRADGCGASALEASSHALDQGRLDGIRVAVAAFTNLGHDHLDYHGDLAAYAAAKRRLFQHPGLGAAVINVDDEVGRTIADELPAGIDLWRCSVNGDARARLSAVGMRSGFDGIAFEISIAGAARAPVASPLVGRFNVTNLLLIGGMLLAAGHPLGAVAATLGELEAVPGRMEPCGVSAAGARVFVDYAHSPDSLEAALSALRELGPRRILVVFGCGGERDRSKRAPMGRVAGQLADHVVITADNPRGEAPAAIAKDIADGVGAGVCDIVLDRAEAIRRALALAGRDEVVLVAGKGHESVQEIAGRRRAFSDRAVVAEALGAGCP